jgi:DNA-binding transcriptional ArsR family regulator
LSRSDAGTEQTVFEALSDPTRRHILKLLRVRGVMTAGAIADGFREISRPGVSRHLRVLRAAGMVRAVEVGREWHYELEPAPLRAVYEQWFASFTPAWDTALRKLKRRAESPATERSGRRRTRHVGSDRTTAR